MSELPEGAFNAEELKKFREIKMRGGGSILKKKFYIVKHKLNSGIDPDDQKKLGGIVNGIIRDLGFDASQWWHYFDNYFHAYACSLQILSRSKKVKDND